MTNWKQTISDATNYAKGTLDELECICNDSFEHMRESERVEFESTITQLATEAKDAYSRLDELLGSIEN